MKISGIICCCPAGRLIVKRAVLSPVVMDSATKLKLMERAWLEKFVITSSLRKAVVWTMTGKVSPVTGVVLAG